MRTVFINRLLDKIRMEVKMFYPRTVVETMNRARQVKKKNIFINEKYVTRPRKTQPKTQTNPSHWVYSSHSNPIFITTNLSPNHGRPNNSTQNHCSNASNTSGHQIATSLNINPAYGLSCNQN